MATTKGILIPWNTDQQVQVVDIDESDNNQLYRLVFDDPDASPEDNTLDFSTMRYEGVQFCYDDLGLYNQPGNINPRAMALWAELAGRDVADFAEPLVGNYVVLGLDPYEGETIDVPVHVVTMLIGKRVDDA